MKTVDDSVEIDLWWGSYSGWSMLPSILVCLFLTAVIVVLVGIFETSEWSQWTVIILVWPLWIVQLGRFSYRVFTKNYRLTTRSLYCDEGFWRIRKTIVPLADIAETRVRYRGLDAWLKRGDVIVERSGQRPLVILECVAQPGKIAEKILRHAASAKEQATEVPRSA